MAKETCALDESAGLVTSDESAGLVASSAQGWARCGSQILAAVIKRMCPFPPFFLSTERTLSCTCKL